MEFSHEFSQSFDNELLPQRTDTADQHQSLYAQNKVDRSQWLNQLLNEAPQVEEMRERIFPLYRGIKFCQIYNPGISEVKSELNQSHIINLILQHLYVSGFRETRRVLEKESQIKLPRDINLSSSRLHAYVKQAVQDTEKMFDLVIGSQDNDNKLLTEHITEMGLFEEEKDLSIWEEPENRILFDGAHVRAASFNKLVEYLTHEEGFDSYMSFVRTFLLTYQSFTSPIKLLDKLLQRFDVPTSLKSEHEIHRIRLKVCNIIKRWLEEFPQDFGEKIVAKLKTFTDEQLHCGNEKYVGVYINTLKKMERINFKPSFQCIHELPPEPIIPKKIFTNFSFFDIDDEEIARQLTIIEWELFSRIKPNELLNQAWSNPKLRHLAPNVLNLAKRSNHFSGFVATEIMNYPLCKDRSKVVTKFIKIAEHLVKLRNFNSMFCIVGALGNKSIYRLKHTHADLQPNIVKIKNEISDIMSADRNFSNYRNLITTCQRPCLPYIGVTMTDLTFLDENSNYIEGLINFNKRTMVAAAIENVLEFQQQGYNFCHVPQITHFLKSVAVKTENELYDLSLKYEPREATRQQIK